MPQNRVSDTIMHVTLNTVNNVVVRTKRVLNFLNIKLKGAIIVALFGILGCYFNVLLFMHSNFASTNLLDMCNCGGRVQLHPCLLCLRPMT